MIKAFVPALVIATALAAPTFAFAQSNGPVTRAQVRAELVQLEKAGYEPSRADRYYPADLQAAQNRVAEQNGTAQPAISSYGGAATGSSQSGRTGSANGAKSIYFGN